MYFVDGTVIEMVIVYWLWSFSEILSVCGRSQWHIVSNDIVEPNSENKLYVIKRLLSICYECYKVIRSAENLRDLQT